LKRTSVLAISDTHFPWHSKRALVRLFKFIQRNSLTHIVQLGDLLDVYVFSKYSKSLGITTAMDVVRGLEIATEFWETIRKLQPNAKCIQLLGNHDTRVSKRISERLPELEALFNFTDKYKFEGVTTLKSDRDYLEIGGVVYVHGWLSKSIDHAKYFNRPCVHGHTHRASIEFDRPDLWSMSCGFLADKDSLPLQYTQSKFSKWTTASGLIINEKPRLLIL
jgi:predicted phosphodiesterase